MEIYIKHNRKPTLLQKKAMSIMVANGGNMPLSKAMRQAGYSESMARNSQKLIRSKAFKDILDSSGLTDELLINKHKELIDSKILKKITLSPKRIGHKLIMLSDKEIENIIDVRGDEKITGIIDGPGKLERTVYYRTLNTKVVLKAINLAFRIKGHLSNKILYETPKHKLTKEEISILNNICKKNSSKDRSIT